MRDNDSHRASGLSRRRYAQFLAGIGAAGLAGCPSDSGDGTATDAGDGGVDAATDPDGAATSTPGADTDAGTDETTDAVRDTIRVGVNNSPDVFNANPWTPDDSTTGDRFLMEITGLGNVHTPNVALSGTTVPTPHKPDREEVEIMTWVEDYSVDPPHDWRQSYDDRATFWNGDPYDAPTLVTHNHVAWFRNGNKYTEGATFNEEVEDQWTRHGWTDRGDAANQDPNPVSKPVLEATVTNLLFNSPLHTDVTQPYLDRYRDAGTRDEVNSISSDLTGERISLQQLAENGWGSGLYELRTVDDIGSESAVLRIRDDGADRPHPNAGHTNVEKLELLWAENDRRQTLQTNGEIDVDDGAITPQATVGREALPDHMQELTRWFNATRGDQWLMNWQNEHLQNLWVRRALVEAVDWNAVSANGWGEEAAQVLEHDTFLLDAEAENTFSSEFLDSLHTWSRSSNVENADEYMRRAGYSRQGGQWVSPEGTAAEISLIAQSGNTNYVEAAQTIKAGLSEWGFGVNFSTQGFSTWSSNLSPEDNGLNYDTSLFWSDTSTVFGKYNDRGAWWGEALLGGSPTADSVFRLTGDDERDTQNKPVRVQLPEEVGSIEAPDEAGIDPDLENGREVDMLEVVDSIREPGNSEAELLELYRTCAQYYNFYVPDFLFNQALSGAWGNVRDFEWPSENSEALDYGRNASVADGVVATGLAQASTDTDFEPPG